MSNTTNYLLQLKNGGSDLIDGIKGDDFEKIGEINNISKHAFEINDDKILTQFYASTIMIKNKQSNANNHTDNFEGIHKEFHKRTFQKEYEKSDQECKKTSD